MLPVMDSVTRFLNENTYDSKVLWQSVKPIVRQHENCDACLIFNDSIIEKAYTDENDLIFWHWDHAKKRGIKGINLLRGFYVCQRDVHSPFIRLPVCYELILKTGMLKDKKERRKSPITKNELMQTYDIKMYS